MTTKTAHLPLPHLLLALAVAAVWGTNFVVIKVALVHLPPLLLATLRFTLAFLPAVFFLKRPAVPWSHLAAYGLLIGAGQFGLLYVAMEHDISPGLASLVIQTQVFFTIGLSMWFTAEEGAALSMAGAGARSLRASRHHAARRQQRHSAWPGARADGGGELGIGQPGRKSRRRGEHAGLCRLGESFFVSALAGALAPVRGLAGDPLRP